MFAQLCGNPSAAFRLLISSCPLSHTRPSPGIQTSEEQTPLKTKAISLLSLPFLPTPTHQEPCLDPNYPKPILPPLPYDSQREEDEKKMNIYK